MVCRRHQLIIATFLLSMLLYVDRVCISVAKGPIARDLQFDDREMGWIFAAFSLGYALFQTPAGAAVDRFGPRRMLAVVVTGWSIFTALTAAATSWIGMIAVRFLFGVGEAGAFPGMARAMLTWLPTRERGLAHGINFSASRLGAALALPLIAWMVERLDWRATFVILGVVGLIWAVTWYCWFRDHPEADSRLSLEERDYILAHRQQIPVGSPPLPWQTLLGSRNLRWMMVQYFASNFTFFFSLTWLLPHLQRRFELSATTAGWLGGITLIFGMLGNWLSGWLVDHWHRQGLGLASRRGVAVIGFAIAAGGMCLLAVSESLTATLAGLCLAVFGADMTLAPSWSYCSDIGGPRAGTVSGTMNMAGNLGALLTSLAFPYLLVWTGSPSPFFALAAALNMLAIFCWQKTTAKTLLEEASDD